MYCKFLLNTQWIIVKKSNTLVNHVNFMAELKIALTDFKCQTVCLLK